MVNQQHPRPEVRRSRQPDNSPTATAKPTAAALFLEAVAKENIVPSIDAAGSDIRQVPALISDYEATEGVPWESSAHKHLPEMVDTVSQVHLGGNHHDDTESSNVRFILHLY